MLPPPRFSRSGAVARATAISEYALMSSAMRKPSREVSTNGRVELVARRERRAVNDEVEAAECFAAPIRDVLDLLVAADVQGKDQRIGEVGRQLADVLLETFALICHGEPGAGVRNRLRDGPRDRPLVGDADDQAMLAGKF